jgi:hypothetical protein
MDTGLNLRLLNDNLFLLVEEFINTTQGWNDTGRVNQPVVVRSAEVANDEVVEPNLVTISLEDINFFDVELGSTMVEQSVVAVVDIIAENHSIGLHLAGDLLGWAQDLYAFPVYDLTQATPNSVAYYCEVNGVTLERNRWFENRSQQWWWVLSFSVGRSAFSGDL